MNVSFDWLPLSDFALAENFPFPPILWKNNVLLV